MARRNLQTQLSQVGAAERERVAGKFFWGFAEQHQLTQKQQAMLLGIKYNRERLNSLKAKQAIPDDQDKRLRVSHLMAIHRSLRVLFSDPMNRDVVYNWLRVPREAFAGKSALEFIEGDDGTPSMPRLVAVRRFLDISRVGGVN